MTRTYTGIKIFVLVILAVLDLAIIGVICFSKTLLFSFSYIWSWFGPKLNALWKNTIEVLLRVFFFQSALKVYIKSNVDVHFYAVWKKCSKCVHLVPNLTHFHKKFESAYFFSKCVTTLLSNNSSWLLFCSHNHLCREITGAKSCLLF